MICDQFGSIVTQFIRHLNVKVCLSSELVSALVRVLPQSTTEHPEHGGERSGSSWQGTAAAPGGLWHHLTGNRSCTLIQMQRFKTRVFHLFTFTRYCAPLYLLQLYLWPLLETLFSEVLTRDEWLRLFDSIFSNHPSFLLMACVAYITCCRQPLLLCSQKQDFEVTTFSPPLILKKASSIKCSHISPIWLLFSISSTTVTTWMWEPW